MGARDLVVRTLQTVLRSIGQSVEGEFRAGPYYLPVTGGWLPDGAAINWWQQGHIPVPLSTRQAMVEACVSAYSQTVAMCPGDHWRSNAKHGRDRVTTSALSRILRYPNDYQSISDFMLNLTRFLYLEGNAYALALRNDRFEVSELHLMDSRMCRAQLAVTGDVFYHLAGNQIIARRLAQDTGGQAALIVPARDVLHVRLHTMYRLWPWPLRGETPLMSALSDIATIGAMTDTQLQFYQNQARPSAVLGTDLPLDKDVVQALRERWNEQVKGLMAGGTPILTHGLKVQPWTTPGKDAMIADMFKLSEQHIALAFRVPLQILGLGQATYRSTEALIQSWLSSGLGFALNHIEEAFGVLFQLKGQPDEYVEFNTRALLRSNYKDRIEGLTRAVQGGILSPNEARNSEDLDSVKFGDEPRVQQQVVPLSAAAAIPARASGQQPTKIPPSPSAPSAPPGSSQPAPGSQTDARQRSIGRQLLSIQRRHERKRAARERASRCDLGGAS